MLLVLQELLLLVLVDLMQLLQVVLLLQRELRLRQELAGVVPLEALAGSPARRQDVGASGGRGHGRGVVADWLPGVRRGEAVEALRDVGVRPDIGGGVVQRLV